MKKYLSNILKLAISLGIGVGIIMWFLSQMSDAEKQQVVLDIKRADYFWVAMGPLVGLISNYFRSERWRILLQSLGYKPGAVNTFLSVMIMYFLNLFFPRLGEVSRCGVLARYENIPVDKAIGTMVLERVMDAICAGILFLTLIAVEGDRFRGILHSYSDKLSDIVAKYEISNTTKYSVFGIVGLAIILFIAYQLRKRGTKNVVNSAKKAMLGLWQGLISIKDVKRPFAFIFHTVMIWVCYFLMVYLSFRMFPETASLGLIVAAVCLFFGAIAMALTPGGLGAYPALIQLVLATYGVVGTAAISFGLVVWSAQTGAVLVAGSLSLALLAIINREPSLKEVTS